MSGRFFCRECGAITEGKERAEMIDGWSCPYTVCEYCGSEDIEEAERCPVCGEWHEEDLCYSECEECHARIFDDFWQIFSALRDEHEDAKRGDIVEAMARAFEDFYNKYRFD